LKEELKKLETDAEEVMLVYQKTEQLLEEKAEDMKERKKIYDKAEKR